MHAMLQLTTLLAAATAAAVPGAIPARDCSSFACPELAIAGDAYARMPEGQASPFQGYADPSIRKDSDRDRIWMAYSWPHVRIGNSASPRSGRRQRGGALPAVETHLAYSDDAGRSWRFQGVLWPARATPEGGLTSIEVPNLLAHKGDEGVTEWYGARMEYTVPAGGMRERSPQSFRLQVAGAASVPDLADAVSVSLGTAGSGADVVLNTLDPAVRHCGIWNEPALQFQDGELYLALSCMAFRGKTPDLARSDLFLFATRPAGDVRQWSWRYVGRLSGAAEARELGGERLTQIELATARDGQLLAIVTPDVWDEERRDFVHRGCRAIEVASLPEARLARDDAGRLLVRARIDGGDSGTQGGGTLDTAACAYDAASDTGIVIGRREKTNVALSGASGGDARMRVTLHATGVPP